MELKDLDIRHISIVDSLPVHKKPESILDVGCGGGRIDYHLARMGYNITAVDYQKSDSAEWIDEENLKFQLADIFDINTFEKQYDTVICSEVLEHLPEYKKALSNLLLLAEQRLIITVPFEKSFNAFGPPPEGHCNFWSDSAKGNFKNINEFKNMCHPYSTSISKIRTKERDVQMNQWDYLIVIDKNQRFG